MKRISVFLFFISTFGLYVDASCTLTPEALTALGTVCNAQEHLRLSTFKRLKPGVQAELRNNLSDYITSMRDNGKVRNMRDYEAINALIQVKPKSPGTPTKSRDEATPLRKTNTETSSSPASGNEVSPPTTAASPAVKKRKALVPPVGKPNPQSPPKNSKQQTSSPRTSPANRQAPVPPVSSPTKKPVEATSLTGIKTETAPQETLRKQNEEIAPPKKPTEIPSPSGKGLADSTVPTTNSTAQTKWSPVSTLVIITACVLPIAIICSRLHSKGFFDKILDRMPRPIDTPPEGSPTEVKLTPSKNVSA